MALLDLRCDVCGWVEVNVFRKKDYPCTCGNGTMRVFWGYSQRLRQAELFHPFTIGEEHISSKEEWRAYQERVASNIDCHPDQIERVDNTNRYCNRRYEEAQQQRLDHIKARGYSPEEYHERIEYNRQRR